MNRCFILGAGFSKAVSDLPVMKDLSKTFRSIRKREEDRNHKNRVIWGDRIFEYFEFLETEFFRKPCINDENGWNYEDCNFEENIESIISFIDLNTSGIIKARIIDKNGKKSSFSKPSLFWNYTDLDELKSCIQTYIYLSLIDPAVKTKLLNSFIDQVNEYDTIITFNYDLIVEKALYATGYWKPKDGYGISFNQFPDISPKQLEASKVKIYKLHGSLNWKSDLSLQFFQDNNEPIFPRYLLKEENNIRQYQGKHSGCWIMPSFIKQFDFPALLVVWQKALDAIKNASNVTVIGYSLPKEDSAACLLFGTTDISEKRFTIVDPNFAKIGHRFQSISRGKKIAKFSSLEDYLDKDPRQKNSGMTD